MTGIAARPVVFEGVWKRFRIGGHAGSLRNLFVDLTRRSKRDARADSSNSVFWALQDVTLEISPGHALGVIGPNGAGKSTILKLLTGILRPTEGRVEVTGRVGALIELAAGFHPDLTGRENVYLQGAIVGMQRAEVARRFDAIVEFAGVGSFIDTPVKRYSNGMNARLGFAIAAHFEPDLLLIDEVLSVGDRAFQTRAIAHVRETIARGVPVVLVSHQLELVSRICNRAVLLSGGRIVRSGSAEECVAEYVRAGDEPTGPHDASVPVRILSITTEPRDRVASSGQVIVRVSGEVTNPEAAERATIALHVRALPSEEVLFFTNLRRVALSLPTDGPFTIEFSLHLHLGEGYYRVQALVVDGERLLDWVPSPSAMIAVEASERFGGRVHLEPVIRFVEPS